MAERAVVGISGGVDSSVAAYLLKQQGYQVAGVHMVTMPGGDETQAYADAQRVCDALDIPLYPVDFTRQFQAHVVEAFVAAYLKGQTPNPCVLCNRAVKWEALLACADRMGAQYVATGHYAQPLCLDNGRYTLRMAGSGKKDQTYALYGLEQAQLARTLMPLGELEKERVRRIAEEIGIPVAAKPDSQDICFVPDGDYHAFLERFGAQLPPPGDFIDEHGNVLGMHAGISHYTIGQRKGLGVAFGKPVYVCRIRPETNEVVLGGNADLFHRHVHVADFRYMALEPANEHDCEIPAYGKIRYNQQAAPCTLIVRRKRVAAVFEEPQRAITPGQAAVFYNAGGCVLGGGTIMQAD